MKINRHKSSDVGAAKETETSRRKKVTAKSEIIFYTNNQKSEH